MSGEDDTPAAPSAASLDKITRDSGRMLAFTSLTVSAALVIAVAVAVTFGWRFYGQIRAQQDQIAHAKRSTCDFYQVIGTLPVTAAGPSKSGRTLVRLIGDARITFDKRGCGTLPPPSPQLAVLAAEYGITVG